MNVLVVGATGYIGSAVCERLAATGHRVTALARNAAARAALEKRGYTAVDGDVARPESLANAAAGADAIVYAVELREGDTLAIDSAALSALIAAAPAARFVYTSGCWVYGATGDVPATEDSPLNPVALVATRPARERIVLDGSAHPIVIRPGVVYGRGGGIPASFVASARSGGAAVVVGDGTTHWPCVHVDDLAGLYRAAIEKAAPHAIYNAADGIPYVVRDLAEAASRGAGCGGAVSLLPLEAARAQMGAFADALTTDQLLSSQRAARDLGWVPDALPAAQDLEIGSYSGQPPSA
jgi:nucleoside-diphosphate-sugar epimerase